MATLEIECPTCGELLELSAEERREFEVGDLLVCSSCETEMEITVNGPGDEFELALVDYSQFVQCPSCGEDFEVSQDMLDSAPVIESVDGVSVSVVECPHCLARIELELEETGA
ncbi:hypothetical protein SAMN04488058_10522 [Deinococcus reticulitermitis]|uniref:Uncharacterized protein n=1 Tax=Deinococcus reticulitermitis TaxID=856736 RepID=A0A1H6XAZ3_9DEIO|nr:hypothetical protein [Deinococcus reticulitermitis]SEJ22050.1 hypothetical protein SAMN04488058_10522 [Deinococcus reticulitermitis]